MKGKKIQWLSVLLAAVLLLGAVSPAAAGQAWLAPEEGQTVEVNHARGAAATANDVETDYWGADKAVDGIVNRDEENKQNQSRWSTNGARTFEQVAQKEKILTIDMGKEQSFDRLVLEWERANITHFKIEGAGDDQVYTVLYEKTDDAQVDSLTTSISLPEKATARYVRLTVSGYTAGDIDWASVSLWEFQILETVSSQDIPNAKPVVVPELAQWEGGKGDFTTADTTRLVVNPQYQEELATAASEFVADYQDVTGRSLSVVYSTQPAEHDFYFTLGSDDTGLGEEGYIMDVTQTLTLEAVNAQGVYWGTRSVLQILAQTGDTIPQGTARDYPLYEVRGFMLDVGRKPISYEFLETILKEMTWYKMNDFQIHLNDNAFQKEYPDATVDIAKQAYSGFRLESDIKAGGNGGLNQADLTSQDMYYTKDQMRQLIQRARALGVDIVPEIDTPAHSLALTKVRPDLIFEETLEGVDHLNLHEKYDESLEFVQSIFQEYISGTNPVFDSQTIVHVGTDEYSEKYKEAFRQYTDDMLAFIQDTGRTVRVWGSLSMRPGTTSVRSEGVQMNVWNTGWANPQAMFDAGYDIINTEDTRLYIVPGVTRPGLVGPYYHDYLDAQWLYQNWTPNRFSNGTVLPADSEQMLGATFAIWNDKSGVHSNGITEQDIYDRFADALPALASKMWGLGQDLTFQELTAAVENIGTAPNNNPRFQASSVNGEYLRYTFAPGQTQQDTSGNGRNILTVENAQTQQGAMYLQGGASYLETPLNRLGFGNALEFDILLPEAPQPGDILFEADSEYDTHDIRIMEDGTLGYTCELYDYSFGYTIPVGQTVHLRIESLQEHTALIVNGVRYEAKGTYREEAVGLNLTDIGYPSFVLPLQRIGSRSNAISAVMDNITVSRIQQAQQADVITGYTASSQYADNPIENAFDGKTNTFWHSNWKPYEPLPATVEITLDGLQSVIGFTYLPRQDNNNNGQITKYDLEYRETEDGPWISLVKDGVWQANNQLKKAEFDPVMACALRFTAKEGTGDAADRSYACAAEFDVLLAESPATCIVSAYAQPGDGGSVSVSQAQVQAGQPVTFTAQANTGWSFTGWYDLLGNLVSQEPAYTMRPESGVTLTAHFEKDHVHTYGEPEFQWSADGKSCTVVFTCTQDTSHVTKLAAKVDSQVTQEATCTRPGTTTYTATVSFQDIAYTDTKVMEDIPMKAHTPELRNAAEPTCTQDGYSGDKVCTVCEKVLEAGQVIPAPGHKYEHGFCTVCGAADPDYTKPTETTEPTEEPATEPTQTTRPATDPEGPDQTGEKVDAALLAVLMLVSAACLCIIGIRTYRQKVR